MIYNVDYQELIEKVNPIAFSKYLQDTGWCLFQSKRKDVRIFQKDIGDFFQVLIPLDETLSDYKEAMYAACVKVARSEERPIEQLILCLLNPNADILKIHIEKKDVEAGSILLDDAISIYENTKKLLGAAAQDVLKPALIHQGRTETAVTDFVSACRFGQTEVGSYVVSVICPMTEIEDGTFRQLELFEEDRQEINFTRQVTEKVVRSIQRVKTRIDEGHYNLTDTSAEDGLSVNFYEALLGINLDSAGTKVDFIPEWAPCIPVPKDTPKRVTLSHQYYAPIQATVMQMRGSEKRKKKIVGRIKKLEASADAENRNAGKITVVYVDDQNKARVLVTTLGKGDYDRAIEAHVNGWYVEIVGETMGKRGGEIKCESFNVL